MATARDVGGIIVDRTISPGRSPNTVVRGIEYRLRIIEEKVAHPPADGSSLRWTLDQVIEQRVVDR